MGLRIFVLRCFLFLANNSITTTVKEEEKINDKMNLFNPKQYTNVVMNEVGFSIVVFIEFTNKNSLSSENQPLLRRMHLPALT